MPVRIRQEEEGFLLDGTNERMQLIISCGRQVASYNVGADAHRDFWLYRAFANANDEKSLSAAVDELCRVYKLGRRRVLRAPEILPHLPSIREAKVIEPRDIESIQAICQRFEYGRQQLNLSRESDVSLSKLLHFIRPCSFWIIDSRVTTLLRLWGFHPSYRGFGDLLHTLSTDPNWGSLLKFLRDCDVDPRTRQGWNDPPCPVLKLIDKVLWW
jgi:hypothetical protein